MPISLPHILAKVELSKKSIDFIWFNAYWLAELIEDNRIKISYEYIPNPEPYNQYQKGQYLHALFFQY